VLHNLIHHYVHSGSAEGFHSSGLKYTTHLRWQYLHFVQDSLSSPDNLWVLSRLIDYYWGVSETHNGTR
jgi:hypothetical protein